MPELALEGDPLVPLEHALVLPAVSDLERLREAHEQGTPVVIRADSPEQILAALRRPEVASVLVPKHKPELLELDLRALTYG